MLEDSNDQSQPVQELAQHDIQLFKDLIALNVKMNRLVVRLLLSLGGQEL